MKDNYRIAAYMRISVDDEKDNENTSIENQKRIIKDYCQSHFPTSKVDYYEDRDYSGYTFDQRPDYYYHLRPKIFSGEYDIFILNDLSRFSRRTSRGLVEFEDILEQNVRIIAINNNIDYRQGQGGKDWTAIQFYFVVNEMTVTQTSAKVSSVIENRQSRGEWICSVPFGYVMNKPIRKIEIEVDEPAAEIVRKVFELYIEGWGYKKIANYLTDMNIPTPRMREKERYEATHEAPYKGKVKTEWSTATVSEIISNDFYIGKFRQHKYRRKKINGADIKLDESEHLVFENHHTPIVDCRIYEKAQLLLKERTNSNYRGVKKYDNTYSSLMRCGDCGNPMFPMSRKDLSEAYRCGAYHRGGTSRCSSHHIRADFLDSVIKDYIRMVKENSQAMLDFLKEELKKENKKTQGASGEIEDLEKAIDSAKGELKTLTLQKTRDIVKHPENAEILEETYDTLIDEINDKIVRLQNQLELTANKVNTIIRVNRVATNVLDVFDDILNQDRLDKGDLRLIIDRILVYEDRVEIKLKADIDELLRTGTIEHLHYDEEPVPVNFNQDTDNIEKVNDPFEIVAAQHARNQRDKVFCVNVISGGDPLEIYTDREGEVIFKKYSPIGELTNFASQYADTLHKVCTMDVIICDRDAVIACAGVSKKEYLERSLSPEFEKLMESRGLYTHHDDDEALMPLGEGYAHFVSCAMPIVSNGDIIGCVASLKSLDGYGKNNLSAEVETRLISTAASFLGRQLEE